MSLITTFIAALTINATILDFFSILNFPRLIRESDRITFYSEFILIGPAIAFLYVQIYRKSTYS